MTKRLWLDHHGLLFEAPVGACTCRDGDGRPRIHYLWRPEDPHQLSPQTLCGRPAGHIPADRDVDCPDCLAIHEASSPAREATGVLGWEPTA